MGELRVKKREFFEIRKSGLVGEKWVLSCMRVLEKQKGSGKELERVK